MNTFLTRKVEFAAAAALCGAATAYFSGQVNAQTAVLAGLNGVIAVLVKAYFAAQTA